MNNHISTKRPVLLLVLCLLSLSFVFLSITYAQDTDQDSTAPPMTRYLDPLPPESLNVQEESDRVLLPFEATSLIMSSDILVFQSLMNEEDWNIFAVNSLGEWIQLSNEPSHEIHPRFNRGVSKLVFASNRTGRYELFLLNMDGSGLVQLTATGSHNVNPAWSKDGSRIAFNSYRDGQSEIYLMNADGSNVQRLTANPGYDGAPVWSPDSSQIAYVTEVGGNPYVWVMNADGSNARQVAPYISDKPVWSPDGKEIVYAGDHDGDSWFGLFRTRLDGSGTEQIYVAYGALVDLIPQSFSPDGRYVAFTRIAYVYHQGNWYWTSATLGAIDTNGGGSYDLPSRRTEWNPDWQTYDTIAPTSSMEALPAISPASFKVSWSGADSGGAGMGFYQLQMREGEEGAWTDWQVDTEFTDTESTEATFTGVGGRRYYFRLRARDRAFNWEPWPQIHSAMTTVESWPPRSQWEMIPRYTRKKHFDLRWSGSDPGNSGIADYDVQMREAPNLAWRDLVSQYQGNLTTFEGRFGATYEFRLRARDRAGNVEPWPAEPIRTTLYTWAITGKAVDNAGVPVTDATVTVNPAAFEYHGDASGAYAAYVANEKIGGNGPSVTWQKQNYGTLPATVFSQAQDVERSIVLPPANNLLVNSHFEAANLGDGWQSSGSLSPTLNREQFHTGGTSAMFGCSVFGPAVRVASANFVDYQLFVDVTGKVHLIWNDYEQSALYYSQRQTGATWSAPELVNKKTGYEDADLRLLADANGRVHVVWKWEGDDQINYLNRSPAGLWSERQTISSPQVYSTDPHLIIDSSGRIHAIWREGSWDLRVVYTSRTTTGEWSAPFVLGTGSYRLELEPLIIGADGTVHVVWNSTDRLNYRRMAGNGVWGEQQSLWDGLSVYNPAEFRVLGAAGRLHLVWSENVDMQQRVLYLQQDAQGNWSKPEAVSPFGYIVADLAANEAGDLVLVLAPQYGGQFLFTERRQGVWSQPVPLSSGPAHFKVDSDVDDTGTIHIIWGEGRPYNESGDTVFYRRRNPDGSWLPVQKLAQPPGGARTLQLMAGPQGTLHFSWNANLSEVYVLSTAMSSGGASVLAQVVTIPAGMESPTLSFLYWADGLHPKNQSQFKVEVSDGNATSTLKTVSANSGGWTHAWSNMNAWQGRPLTITMRLDQSANQPCASVFLDEVTLGSAYPDLWISGGSTTAAMPGQPVHYTLTYGNRGGGKSAAKVIAVLPAQVSLVDATPAPTVSGKTLTWEVGDLPAHSQPLQIVISGTVDLSTAMMNNLKLVATIEATLTEQEKANNQVELPTFVGHRLHLPAVRRE
jgi:Tol biopolymer transport system component